MRVIVRKTPRKFWEDHPEAHRALFGWYTFARKADWKSFDDTKAFARSADQVGRCVVFNAGGNKYRLVVRVHYVIHRAYIVGVFTHREYDEDEWKREC